MDLNEYQEKSKRTMKDIGSRDQIINYTFGLTGETGEVSDLVKKLLYHGHKVDQHKIVEELGDVLHYLAGLATHFDLDLNTVAQMNIDKLKHRYPNGFSEEASRNRTPNILPEGPLSFR